MKTINLPSNPSESQLSCRHCYAVTMTSGMFLSTCFLSTGPIQTQKDQLSLPLGFCRCLFDLVLRSSHTLDWTWTPDPLAIISHILHPLIYCYHYLINVYSPLITTNAKPYL